MKKAAADRHISRVGKASIRGKHKGIKSWLPFLGPAFMVSTAYFDPGSIVVNIQTGSVTGYLLIWVVVIASLIGIFIQLLSAKLGIATKKNLAELCRENLPKWADIPLWLLTEVVMLATDLSDFIGTALGLHILFGIPLLESGLIAAIVSFGVLVLHYVKGFRILEIVVTCIVFLVVAAFAFQVFYSDPDPKRVLDGFIPEFKGFISVYLAAAIMGATIMPHVIFLHSGLTQKRVIGSTDVERKKLFRFQIMDVSIAMGIATIINVAILILSAAVFYDHGLRSIHGLTEAYEFFRKYLGNYMVDLFGVCLLLSGLASSIMSLLAGKICMDGFIKKKSSIFWRRSLSIIPSLIILGGLIQPTKAMIIAQVVLAFGIPFAIIPLVIFTKNKNLMGKLVNRPITTFCAVVVTVLVISLNIYFLSQLRLFGMWN